MKKILSILLVLLLCASTLCGCSKQNDLKKVKVSEVARSVFYAPQYAALSLGYFEEEGLDVEVTTAQGADKVLAAVLSGDSDIGFCGPEATIYVNTKDNKDYAVNFAQVTKRDGSFLVGRKDEKDTFEYSDLKGSYIIGGREGGVPEMTLEYVLKKNGLDIKKDVTIDTSVQFAAMAGTFVGGTGDYVALFEPSATEVEKANNGYVLKSLGEESGEVPYTVYNALKSYVKDNPETIQSFTNAVYKGLKYVKETDSKEVAKAIKDYFPDTDEDVLTNVIQRYKDIDAWKDTPELSKDSFERLQDIMALAGHLDKRADYGTLVDNTFAKNIK